MTHHTVHEWGRVRIGEGGFTRGQADTLFAAARAHTLGGADGTDILCDHHSYARARQMVGVVAGRGCSLEILPKVDPAGMAEDASSVRARLVHMLDVALDLKLSVGETSAMSHRAESLLEFFIGLFADRLLGEVRRGLPRQYRVFDEDLGALRGRLDVVRQFTVNTVRPDRLACRFDGLDADTPLLRIMKACVLMLARHARSIATQRKLAELRFLLADVPVVSHGALPWREVRIDRTSLRWKTLLDLSRLLMGERWQETHSAASDPDGITLLFPMNDLFERYIAIQLRRALAGTGFDVTLQGGMRYCLGPWRENQDCIGDRHSTRPDVLVRHGGKIVTVIDTKWKHLSKGVSQTDIYQMMAYARLYSCNRLILLYPAIPGDGMGNLQSYGLSQGPERLDIVKVAIEQNSAAVRVALLGLIIGKGPSGAIQIAPASLT